VEGVARLHQSSRSRQRARAVLAWVRPRVQLGWRTGRGLRARARAGMYGSLPFALAQCVVEVPYNLVQVLRAAGTLRRAQTPCSCQAGVFMCLSRPRFPGRLQAPRMRC